MVTNWLSGFNDWYACFYLSTHETCNETFTERNECRLDGVYYPYSGRYRFYYSAYIHGIAFFQNPFIELTSIFLGGVERNPDTECTASSVINKEMSDEVWPALFKKRHVKEASSNLAR